MNTKILAVILIAACSATSVNAQENDTSSLGKDIKRGVKSAGKATAKGAKAVGNKTAELASKGSSSVIDKTYKGKTGPKGETVYIDNKSQYYYVNKQGKRVYIKVLDLRNRP